MRLATFVQGGTHRIAALAEEAALDLSAAANAPASLRDLLEAGPDGAAWLQTQLERRGPRLALAELQLAAPIPAPRKFLALGGNYQSHLAEAAKVNVARGPGQTWFNKQVTCVRGPYETIWKPAISEQLDYEGELGVVIGARCRAVRAADWRRIVAGYVVVNDLSVRDWQMRAPTHTLGKSFDTHGPFGPWLTTADEIDDPHALHLQTFVNGQKRQSASTADMIHSIGEMIEELTSCFTLEPGDVLSTGSPAGVGGLMTPPAYLRVGDVVRIEIDKLGAIENRVVAEPAPPSPFPHHTKEAVYDVHIG